VSANRPDTLEQKRHELHAHVMHLRISCGSWRFVFVANTEAGRIFGFHGKTLTGDSPKRPSFAEKTVLFLSLSD